MKLSDLHDPAAAAEIIKQFKKRYSSKVCLAPQKNCEGSIVSAHTLSLSSMLRPLSRDGKVYALKPNIPPAPGQQPVEFALRSLRETSVFYGFCAKHDKALFSPIEDKEFVCSPEQLFIFSYRAVARETYLKRKQAEGIPAPEDIKKIHGITENVEFSTEALLFQAASLQDAEEIERLKARLDARLLNGDYRRLVTTVFEFASPPPISASFVYAPDFTFEGEYLQDFEDFGSDLSLLMVSLFPTATGGFLLLSHEDTANAAPSRLIETLKSQDDISSSVTWFIACQTENFAISPNWFEALSEENQDYFKNGLYSNANPFCTSINNLRKRKIKVSDWNLRHIFTL